MTFKVSPFRDPGRGWDLHLSKANGRFTEPMRFIWGHQMNHKSLISNPLPLIQFSNECEICVYRDWHGIFPDEIKIQNMTVTGKKFWVFPRGEKKKPLGPPPKTNGGKKTFGGGGSRISRNKGNT